MVIVMTLLFNDQYLYTILPCLYISSGFNAAQYLQSETHHYGLAENFVTTYYKIAASGTIDEVVDERLALRSTDDAYSESSIRYSKT